VFSSAGVIPHRPPLRNRATALYRHRAVPAVPRAGATTTRTGSSGAWSVRQARFRSDGEKQSCPASAEAEILGQQENAPTGGETSRQYLGTPTDPWRGTNAWTLSYRTVRQILSQLGRGVCGSSHHRDVRLAAPPTAGYKGTVRTGVWRV